MTKPALLSTLLAALVLAAPAAHALFKVVGPDGKVTYTDRPPAASAGSVAAVDSTASTASSIASLPYALRQIAQRFPVTLYTMKDCGDACALARTLLAQRGIPYAERIAETNEEREGWTGLVGGVEAPVLKVGQQSLRGFNPAAWNESLDTAGYPRQSTLPASYRPAVQPLIERRADPAPRPAVAPVPPPTDPASNPAGIRF
jgi:glutaredoxin